MPHINRTQLLLLGFTLVSWLALVTIFATVPGLFDDELRPFGLAGIGTARPAFLAAVSGLLLLLAIGVLRRWRWMFWVLLLAFAAGALRPVIFALQMLGALPFEVPVWYAGLQALVGVVQAAIASAMYAGYRKRGVWGAF